MPRQAVQVKLTGILAQFVACLGANAESLVVKVAELDGMLPMQAAVRLLRMQAVVSLPRPVVRNRPLLLAKIARTARQRKRNRLVYSKLSELLAN